MHIFPLLPKNTQLDFGMNLDIQQHYALRDRIPDTTDIICREYAGQFNNYYTIPWFAPIDVREEELPLEVRDLWFDFKPTNRKYRTELRKATMLEF